MSVVFLLTHKKKTGIVLCIATLTMIYLFSITPVASRMLGSLEKNQSYPDIEAVQGDVIVILGGGTIKKSLRGHRDSLSNQSLARTYHGYLLWKKKKVPIIVTSGIVFGNGEPEASIMADKLIEFGVSSHNIIQETESRSSIENAINVLPRLVDNNYQTIFLVTSAYHMQRSTHIFQKLGIDVLSVPVDYRVSETRLSFNDFFPNMLNLFNSYIALHEYVGLFFVRLSMKQRDF